MVGQHFYAGGKSQSVGLEDLKRANHFPHLQASQKFSSYDYEKGKSHLVVPVEYTLLNHKFMSIQEYFGVPRPEMFP
jgi:hypothetical protein